MDRELTTLVQMRRGQRGTVLQLQGGRGLVNRLNPWAFARAKR